MITTKMARITTPETMTLEMRAMLGEAAGEGGEMGGGGGAGEGGNNFWEPMRANREEMGKKRSVAGRNEQMCRNDEEEYDEEGMPLLIAENGKRKKEKLL